MRAAAELRAEAARMREFARTVTDPEVLSEVYAMIEEWERSARLHDNGDAGGENCRRRLVPPPSAPHTNGRAFPPPGGTGVAGCRPHHHRP